MNCPRLAALSSIGKQAVNEYYAKLFAEKSPVAQHDTYTHLAFSETDRVNAGLRMIINASGCLCMA